MLPYRAISTLKQPHARPQIAPATSDRAAIRSEFIAADAVIVGDAASAYNTLGKLEDKIQEEAVTARAAEAANANDIGHLVTLSGMAADADHMGTFTGATIADNQTVKQAAQALETALEAEEARAAAAEAANEVHIDNLATLSGMAKDAVNMATFTGSTIADNQTAKQALQALETGLESEAATARAAEAAEATTARAAEAANEVHIDNLATLSGMAKDAVNMATFTGSTIADSSTVKAGMQALETALEAEEARAAAAEAANEVHIDNAALLSGVAKDAVNMGAFTGAIIADNQTAKQAFQALETGLESEASTRASADSALSGRLDTVEAGLTAGVVWKASVANLAALDALVEANITNGWAYYVQATKDVYVKVATAGDYQPAAWVTAGFLKIADFTEISGLVTAEATTRSNADTAEAATRAAADTANEVHIDNLATLSGVAKDSVHLGTFSGSAIADNGTVKAGLQALETALEVVVNGSAVTASTIGATGAAEFDSTVGIDGNLRIGAAGASTIQLATSGLCTAPTFWGTELKSNRMIGLNIGGGVLDFRASTPSDPSYTLAGGAYANQTELHFKGRADFDGTIGVTGNVSAPLFEGALQAASVQTHLSRVDAGLDSAPSLGSNRIAELSYAAGVYTLKSATIDQIQAHADAAIAAQEVIAAAARAVLAGRATFLEGRVVRQNFSVASNNQHPASFTLSNLAVDISVMVYVNGLLQEEDGVNGDYQMSDNGTVSTVTFNTPGLITGDKVSVKYDKRL